MRSRTCPLLPLLAVALLIEACDGVDRISVRPAIESISISPNLLTLERGTTSVLRVRAFAATGEELSSPTANWTVRDPNVAIVSAQSVLIALRGGVTEVRATVGARSASATVTVTDSAIATVATLELLPRRELLWIGDTLSFTARARNKFSELVSNTGVQWSSSSPSVAAVSSDGVVRGLSAGTSTISATSGGVTGSVEITVEALSSLEVGGARIMPPGSEAWLTLGAVRRGILYATNAVWTSSDSTVARIFADGRVTALRAGASTIVAVRDGAAYTTQITVRSLAGSITFLEDGVLRVLPLGDGLGETIPLVNGAPLRSSSAAASPDGRNVAFDCLNGICVAPLAGGADARLVISAAGSPSWSADGRTLAARSNVGGIAVLDLASGRLESVRPPFSIERARISPNGAEIAFECDYEYAYEVVSDVCITPMLTTYALTVISNASRVAWAGDGRLSYFRSGLCTALRTDPARCIRIFAPGADETTIESAWSPGSTHLVVARADGLWIVEPDGANPVRVRLSSRVGSQLAALSWTLSP